MYGSLMFKQFMHWPVMTIYEEVLQRQIRYRIYNRRGRNTRDLIKTKNFSQIKISQHTKVNIGISDYEIKKSTITFGCSVITTTTVSLKVAF